MHLQVLVVGLLAGLLCTQPAASNPSETQVDTSAVADAMRQLQKLQSLWQSIRDQQDLFKERFGDNLEAIRAASKCAEDEAKSIRERQDLFQERFGDNLEAIRAASKCAEDEAKCDAMTRCCPGLTCHHHTGLIEGTCGLEHK